MGSNHGLLQWPLKRDPFAITHEGEGEFLAAFVVEFYLGIKIVMVYGLTKRLAGHCDNKVI